MKFRNVFAIGITSAIMVGLLLWLLSPLDLPVIFLISIVDSIGTMNVIAKKSKEKYLEDNNPAILYPKPKEVNCS